MKLAEMTLLTVNEAIQATPQGKLITMKHQDYEQFVALLKQIYHEAPDFADLTKQTQSGVLAQINGVLKKAGVDKELVQISKEIIELINFLKNKFTTERGVWNQGRNESLDARDVAALIKHFGEINEHLLALRNLAMKYKDQFTDAYDIFYSFTKNMKAIQKLNQNLTELAKQLQARPENPVDRAQQKVATIQQRAAAKPGPGGRFAF